MLNCFLRLAAVLIVVATVYGDDKPCTLKHEGRYYDLNPLSSSKDCSLKTPGGHDFFINICRNLAQDSWHPNAPDAKKVAGVLRADHGDISIGEVNTTLGISHNHPQLLLTNGSPCKGSKDDSSLRASTIIEFHCDHRHKGAGTPRVVGILPPEENSACGMFIEWKTAYACATHDSNIGFFGGLFIAIGSILATYLILGTLYNRIVLGLSGYDQIPQFSLSSTRYHASEAYAWVKEYASGVRSGRMSNYDRMPSSEAGGGGFRRPSQGANSSVNPFSFQPQAQPELTSGGFVRPSSVAADKRPSPGEINPVSHQSQVSAEQKQQQQQPRATASLAGQQLQSRKLADVQKSTAGLGKVAPEEKEFMLGDDDDEEDEDGRGPDAGAPSTDGAGSERHVEGRSEMGADGVIRL